MLKGSITSIGLPKHIEQHDSISTKKYVSPSMKIGTFKNDEKNYF